VDLQDLFITKQLSKNPAEYRHNVMQAIAAKQLVSEGVQVSAGQNVSYILQEANGLSGNAVLTSELIDGPVQYDVQKYKQLLIDSTAALLSPLGYDKQRLNELFKVKAS
jgi:DNA polymerase elongation subunit (family B)